MTASSETTVSPSTSEVFASGSSAFSISLPAQSLPGLTTKISNKLFEILNTNCTETPSRDSCLCDIVRIRKVMGLFLGENKKN